MVSLGELADQWPVINVGICRSVITVCVCVCGYVAVCVCVCVCDIPVHSH